jgi:hypothetical protein
MEGMTGGQRAFVSVLLLGYLALIIGAVALASFLATARR